MSVTKSPLPDSLTTELEADVYRAVKAVQDATPENLTTEIEQQVYRAIVAAGGTVGGGGGGGGTPGAGIKRGSVDAYHNVTFGGSDGRRAIFWGETEADEAYILCDGGSDGFGGTLPDLRDRMILGASDTRPAGTTGGTAAIFLTGLSIGETTLTIEQIPAHAHGYRMIDYNASNGYYQADPQSANKIGYSSQHTTAVGGSKGHTHGWAGHTGAESNLPPFYALAFVCYVGK